MPCSPKRRFAIGQRAQRIEAVGGNEAAGHELPERLFHFGRQTLRAAHDVGEERCAAQLDLGEYFARGVRERRQFVAFGQDQFGGVLAREQRDRCELRRTNAALAAVGGRGERRMRREIRPHITSPE